MSDQNDFDLFDTLTGLGGPKRVEIPTAKLFEEKGKLYGYSFDGRTRNFVKNEVKLDPKTGYWYRSGTFDKGSVKQCITNYDRIPVQDLVVLDLGANVGGFTKMALAKGAKQVISVEPCPYNHAILSKNAPGAINLWGGVVAEAAKGDTINYIYSTSKTCSSVSSSTQKRRISSSVAIDVPAFGILDILSQYKPDIIKCDIEGGEYELLDVMGSIPDFVKVAFFEFHKKGPVPEAYPDRFFPTDKWDRFQSGGGRFDIPEILFTRR